ncbi:MAG: protein-L-isoaspartate(D-aspartate) O-methyltransferase [Candidatus Aureabacteria bacterium]|nr:protein-L-isoaspartate(D-aspartate) O-methyltransferase [Candidatus Auribacterota bacterium]
MESKNQHMIQTQIISRGVRSQKVLDAMQSILRHEFVPAQYRAEAYEDRPVSIGYGQTISQPYIVALMTELLDVQKTDKVLEIGTGSGYQAAVLSRLAKKVYTMEIIPELAQSAKSQLKNKGYKNIEVICGDGYKGWPEQAPFQKIIITAAPPQIPQELIKQLADGGIMVVPVGEIFQELLKIEKKSNNITSQSIIPVRFVPMVKGSEE